MTGKTIKTATKSDENSVIAVMTTAFSSDPAVRWMYPDSARYLANFPKFVKIFGGKAFDYESAHYVEGFAGAAMWLPPGVRLDEDALVELLQSSVAATLQEDMFFVFEQMGKYHPEEPHWYLPLIGADPIYQGEGCGSALLAHTLKACDDERLPAYLESTNPKNIPLYERHGFEVVGKIQTGASPPIFPMLRQAR